MFHNVFFFQFDGAKGRKISYFQAANFIVSTFFHVHDNQTRVIGAGTKKMKRILLLFVLYLWSSMAGKSYITARIVLSTGAQLN